MLTKDNFILTLWKQKVVIQKWHIEHVQIVWISYVEMLLIGRKPLQYQRSKI